MAGVYTSDVDTTHIGEFQYLSTNDAFSEHIVNYFGSGAPFQVGNTTIPDTHRHQHRRSTKPIDDVLQ